MTEALSNLIGKRVYVYRNLHKDCFSVMLGGKVVAHVPEIHLKDVEFRVRQKGREKVLRENRKNVHAFVIGTVILPHPSTKLGFEVTYNPYKRQNFYVVEDGGDIKWWPFDAVLKNCKVYI